MLGHATVDAPTFPIPTLRRLEFDNEFVPERRSVVVHSDRYLGAKAASHEAIVLNPAECNGKRLLAHIFHAFQSVKRSDGSPITVQRLHTDDTEDRLSIRG